MERKTRGIPKGARVETTCKGSQTSNWTVTSERREHVRKGLRALTWDMRGWKNSMPSVYLGCISFLRFRTHFLLCMFCILHCWGLSRVCDACAVCRSLVLWILLFLTSWSILEFFVFPSSLASSRILNSGWRCARSERVHERLVHTYIHGVLARAKHKHRNQKHGVLVL
jgi:hypothetical protein